MKTWLRDAEQQWSEGQRAAVVTMLALLDRCRPARVTELAEHARLDVSVVSRQIAHCERAGLVARAPDPVDGRAHRLSLTDEGARLLATERARVAAGVEGRLAAWSPDEIADVSARVRRLLADLGR